MLPRNIDHEQAMSIFQWIMSNTYHRNTVISLVQRTNTSLSLAKDLQMTEDKKFKNLEWVFSHESKALTTFLSKSINNIFQGQLKKSVAKSEHYFI